MLREQPQRAQVPDVGGVTVDKDTADGARAEADQPAAGEITAGDDLTEIAINLRRREVARLAAEADRDAARHRGLGEDAAQVRVIGRARQLDAITPHGSLPRRR